MALIKQITEEHKIITALLRYVDERLKLWAAWYRQRERLGIGYPPCSVEYRMMTEGCIPRGEYLGLRPMPTNLSAEEIEAFIAELNKQYEEAAQVIRRHYIDEGNVKEKAKLMNIKHEQFYELISFSRAWLLGRLTPTHHLKQIMNNLKFINNQK